MNRARFLTLAAALAPALALLLAAPAPALAAAAAAAGLPPEQETEHVVLPGETLGGIAARAKVPRVLIAEANGLAEPFALRAGQKLKIPRTRRHTVEAGETGFSIAYAYAVPWKDIAVANGLDPDAAVRAGQSLLIPTVLAPPPARPAAQSMAAPIPPVATAAPRFAWPLTERKVRRTYAPRSAANHHDGIDIPAAEGGAVRAAAAGKVIFAGDKADYGNLVIIEHEGAWHTAYGFLSKITVTVGEAVNQGERIGLVGRTGLAKGSELHFEIRKDNAPLDPAKHLPSGK